MSASATAALRLRFVDRMIWRIGIRTSTPVPPGRTLDPDPSPRGSIQSGEASPSRRRAGSAPPTPSSLDRQKEHVAFPTDRPTLHGARGAGLVSCPARPRTRARARARHARGCAAEARRELGRVQPEHGQARRVAAVHLTHETAARADRPSARTSKLGQRPRPRHCRSLAGSSPGTQPPTHTRDLRRRNEHGRRNAEAGETLSLGHRVLGSWSSPPHEHRPRDDRDDSNDRRQLSHPAPSAKRTQFIGHRVPPPAHRPYRPRVRRGNGHG